MSDLDRLAEIVGIEPFYWDIFGNRRETSEATKKALIGAMGLPVATAQEVAASLREEEDGPWLKLLPPCVVGDENTTVEIPLSIPAREDGATLNWNLYEESGAVHAGEVAAAALPEREVRSISGETYRRRILAPTIRLAMGYHEIEIRLGDRTERTRLIIAPERCTTVGDVVTGGRTWGIGLQLYSLRSESDWGIGDFDDLGRFAEEAARLGAGLVGLNPLHQLFPADPGLCSPYSPSTRRGLNILYIDVESVPEFAESADVRSSVASADFQSRLAAARSSAFVDYAAVTALKLPVLRQLHRTFIERHRDAEGDPRGTAFRDFAAGRDGCLGRFAVYEALQEHFAAANPDHAAWQCWPEPYQNPNSPEVAAFVRDHAEQVEFFLWAQFEADRQLAVAADRGRRAGLRVGFYRDLAVAVNPGGASVWADRKASLQGVSVGSPPDAFNLMGQNWGLSPLSPLNLRRTGYAAFIAAMRANMQHAAALRIDHVMALKHLFWHPNSGEPGAYVRYPFHDLLRIVALESRRAGCVIIGEDLGTVPEGFRPLTAKAGVLSYRVLYFERNPDGTYVAPGMYPAQALATVTTHDLATFRGFWDDRDLDWRVRLGLYPDDRARDRDKWERGVDRWRMLQALNAAGLRPGSYPNDEGAQPWRRELAEAVHRYLARTPSQIVMLQIEDALSETEQPNLPGTVNEHPNWRRRLPVKVETISSDEGIAALANAVRTGREPPL